MARASEDTTTVTGPPQAAAGAAEPAAKVRRGPLRRLLNRLSAETEELDAEELEAAIPAQGATPIAQCPDREPVCIIGTLRTVTFRPRAGVPALQAELWDGTGSVSPIETEPISSAPARRRKPSRPRPDRHGSITPLHPIIR